ncbi:hypothetical protein T492DRAFT_866986 [Pavlovales sp. CCMP2436]|nr:hypothetical protein T492DRAFT_866986 [Pavlovales sp. CCMP2436]
MGCCGSAAAANAGLAPASGRNETAEEIGPTIDELLAKHAGALAELRAIAAAEDGYDAAKHDGLHLLRFLLSHKLNAKLAAKAFATALAWRRANGIDAIADAVRGGLKQSQFPHYAKIHPRLPFHFSELGAGQPTMFFSVRELRLTELMREMTTAEYVLYSQYISEHIHQTTDFESRRTGRIVKLVRLIDATGIGLATLNMKYISAVAAAARGSEDAYPQVSHG